MSLLQQQLAPFSSDSAQMLPGSETVLPAAEHSFAAALPVLAAVHVPAASLMAGTAVQMEFPGWPAIFFPQLEQN